MLIAVMVVRCLFYTSEDKYVALESVFYAGQHVGFSDDGIPQPPGETPPLDKTALFLPFPHSSVSLYSYCTSMRCFVP